MEVDQAECSIMTLMTQMTTPRPGDMCICDQAAWMAISVVQDDVVNKRTTITWLRMWGALGADQVYIESLQQEEWTSELSDPEWDWQFVS